LVGSEPAVAAAAPAAAAAAAVAAAAAAAAAAATGQGFCRPVFSFLGERRFTTTSSAENRKKHIAFSYR
jgi:hypothetical protein